MHAATLHPETRCVVTPHPVTCDGQTNLVAEFLPGEKLGAFLRRTVDKWADDAWEVRVNGLHIATELLDRVRPKSGTLIEVRGAAKKQALYIVAMIALTYFTMGAGAGWIAGAAGVAAGGTAAMLIGLGVFMAGPAIGGKVIR